MGQAGLDEGKKAGQTGLARPVCPGCRYDVSSSVMVSLSPWRARIGETPLGALPRSISFQE